MDKISKKQKDEYATAFAILALYDGGVSALAQVWLENVKDKAKYLAETPGNEFFRLMHSID